MDLQFGGVAVMEQWKVKRELMKTFNDIAYAFDATRRREWSEVHLFICKSGLTADFGCGSGRNLLPILIFNREVLAIDISVEMLKIFLKKALKIHKYFFANAVLCDLNHLPLRDSSIDNGICFAAIHHIPSFKNRLDALIEIYRVLKPFSFLVISVWAKYQGRFLKHIPKMFLNYITRRVSEFGDIYIPWRSGRSISLRFYHLFSRREFKKLLKRSGFKVAIQYSKNFKSRFFAENHVAIMFKPVKKR